jgi:hypothetical protein
MISSELFSNKAEDTRVCICFQTIYEKDKVVFPRVRSVQNSTKTSWWVNHSNSVLHSPFVVSIDFLIYDWPFILFKILVQVCTIISYIWTLFSDKTNHNKIYNKFIFLLKQMVKHNSKGQRLKQKENRVPHKTSVLLKFYFPKR